MTESPEGADGTAAEDDLAGDDEFTQLVDADFPRVDLVKSPANGAGTFLIAKQAAGQPGLFGPQFVRALIAKAARPDSPQPASPGSDLIVVTKTEMEAVIDTEVSAILRAQREKYQQVIDRQAADVRKMQAELGTLQTRLAVAEQRAARPAAPGVPPVDVAKALERKGHLYGAADVTEQNRLAQEMQQDAIAAFSAIRTAGARRG